MRSKITLFAVTIAAIFTSCSKEAHFSYSDQNYGGYHKTETIASNQEKTVETSEPATLNASTEAQPVISNQSIALATPKTATSEATAKIEETQNATPAVTALPKTEKEVKAIAKQIKKEVKKTKEAKADGKSQIVAAILAFLLGTLGIHRFYLGYTGKGILQLAMFVVGAITALFVIGFFILLALWIWVIIDFIRILTGGLKPNGGEYAKTL